jgi:TolB-like protein/AraC-like DNA-binding protein/Flp pilus assembly protein TadD
MKASETVLLDKFNQILESNFHKSDFGIDEICQELGTSRSQLYRLIKEQTQLSTSLYIRQRKLIKAKELLKSEMKTAEIAYLLGIDSPQNFSKYFAREFGITPSAYRKQVSDGKNDVLEEEVLPDEESNLAAQASAYLPFVEKPFVQIKPNRYISAGIALVICMVIAALAWKVFLKKSDDFSLASFSGNSIAIMPFTNLGTPATAYFCDGIMEQVHGSLSLISKLKVISTTSSARYKDSPKLAPQIGEELDVNYLLEGSVLQADKKIRINVELVRAGDDRTVWTKSYDGDTKDVFAYLNTVSREVAFELNQKLSNAAEQKLGKVPTTNPEAYNEYLRAGRLIISRKREELAESIARLNAAIALDPEFAAAYASLGHAYHLSGESEFIDAETSVKMTEQNSLTAIRLDPENALAYANLANTYRNQHKWEQSKTAFEIALKYGPNDALVNYWYSLLLRSTGNLEEAVRYSSKAVALDPLHHVIFGGHVTNCLFAGEIDMAKQQIDDGRLLFSDSFVYNWVLASYYGSIKNYRQAVFYSEKANQLNPKIKSIRYAHAFYQGLNGQSDEVRAFLKKLPDLPENYVSRAVGYASLHDKKHSLYYLQKAADLGSIPTDLKVSPFFAQLRNEPQYQTILTRFGL